MKKDIEIPEVKDVFVAAIYTYNTAFKEEEWNAYLLNQNNEPIETVLIVSTGSKSNTRSSTIRHKIDVLPAKSFSKIELLTDDLIKINNRFSVSYFYRNKMYHKDFVFKAGNIKQSKTVKIPLIGEQGILAE